MGVQARARERMIAPRVEKWYYVRARRNKGSG